MQRGRLLESGRAGGVAGFLCGWAAGILTPPLEGGQGLGAGAALIGYGRLSPRPLSSAALGWPHSENWSNLFASAGFFAGLGAGGVYLSGHLQQQFGCILEMSANKRE